MMDTAASTRIDSGLNCILSETIQGESRLAYQTLTEAEAEVVVVVEPCKLWICAADDEEQHPSKRKKRRIPKSPNPNIGVRNLFIHLHDAAVLTCLIRADHGVGRSTLAHHLANTWASRQADIPKLEAFEAVFLISARSIADELTNISVASSICEEGDDSGGSTLDLEDKTLPDTKTSLENDIIPNGDFFEWPEDESAENGGLEENKHQDTAGQDEAKPLRTPMQKAMDALISALLPMSTAIHGPEAVLECLLGMDVLLIIDDAEDLQPCGLEGLQHVLKSFRGAGATTLLLADPDGYKRITQTLADVKLLKLDLCGLGREDIVAEAKLYVDAKKAEMSSKLQESSTPTGELPDPLDKDLQKSTETSVEKDGQKPELKSTEMQMKAQGNVEESDTKKSNGKKIKKSPGDEGSKTSVSSLQSDKETKSRNMDTDSSTSTDSSAMKAKAFLNFLTGMNSKQKTNDLMLEEVCEKPRGIVEFLSRNMCRLEKVLRFPDMLIRTCDMFMDSPDLFDGLTTTTDLLWTLTHWEGVNAYFLSGGNENSQDYSDSACNSSHDPGGSKEERGASRKTSITMSEISSADPKSSGNRRKSSRLSGDFSEFIQKCSGRNQRKLHQNFDEKMYSWLLFLGEKSLSALVNNERTEEGDDGVFKAMRTHTGKTFDGDMAECLMNKIYRPRKFFAFSSVPDNVETFVADRVRADQLRAIQLKLEMSACENIQSDNITNDDDAANKRSSSQSSSDDKSELPEGTSTETALPNENNASTSENLETTTENGSESVGFVSSNEGQCENSEIPSSAHSKEVFTNGDDCSPENHLQNQEDESSVKDKPSEPRSVDMNHVQDDSSSLNFWDEILGDEKPASPESVNANDKSELENVSKVNVENGAVNLENDGVGIKNSVTDGNTTEGKSEKAGLDEDSKSVLVNGFGSHNNAEEPLPDTINKTSVAEETVKSLESENSLLSCNEEELTPGVLSDNNKMINDTIENKMNGTILTEENKNSPTEISKNDEGTVKENENFANSNEDFWGEILGSGNSEPEGRTQLKQNEACENSMDGGDENEKKNLESVLSENKSDTVENQESCLPETIKMRNAHPENLDESSPLIETSQDSVGEELKSKVSPQESLEPKDKPTIANNHVMNGNISEPAINGFSDDSNNYNDDIDFWADISDNHCAQNMTSNSETHIPQAQQNGHECSQEHSPMKMTSMNANRNDYHSESLDDKFPPALNSLENGKPDAINHESITRQSEEDKTRCNNDLEKKISEQVNGHDEALNELVINGHNEINEDQQKCLKDGTQNKEETCCKDEVINEKRESVEISAEQEQQNEQQEHEQQQQQQQQEQEQNLSVINECVGTILEEHSQLPNTTDQTLDETHSPPASSRTKSSEEEEQEQEQQCQERVESILQDLRTRDLTALPPKLTIRNLLMKEFLASWFLVHEIQSGRSLLSLTSGSRRCLRQICVFGAGLVNRIRKLVGYNTDVNRQRVVSALLNHRSDSFYDLPLNMDLVTEFKAYPDLLSFTVEASEYPDEWHLSLYEVQLVPLQALLLNVSPSRLFIYVEDVRPFSEHSLVLEFVPRVEILVWLDSGCQFVYGNQGRMDEVVAAFSVQHVVLAKVELVSGCLTHNAITNLPSHATYKKNLVYLKLRVLDIDSLSALLSIDRQLKHLLWLEVKLDFDWISEDESRINSLPRSSVPLFDAYLRGFADENVVRVSSILSHMHQRYSGIHLEATSLTPEGVYVLLKQLKQKEIRLYSHPTARQKFRRWYYPQLADNPAPSDDLAREKLGYDDRVFYSNHFVESSTYAIAIDAWNLTSFLEEEERIVHFVYTTDNLKFVKSLSGRVEVESTREG